MSCLLEKINKQSCLTLTEAVQQTKLQTETKAGVNWRVELEKTVHAAAALELARLSKLRQQLLECCSEKIEPPACAPEPCPCPEGLAPPPERAVVVTHMKEAAPAAGQAGQ